MNCAEHYYAKTVEPPESSIDYLLSRGITRDEISSFGIRFFDESPYLVGPKNNDYKKFYAWSKAGSLLPGKLVFPFRNSQNELVGFEIRDQDDIKPFKSRFWIKLANNEGVFYGLDKALEEIWSSECVYLTEGVFDFHPLRRLYSNSLGVLTAHISANQLNFLRRYVKRVFTLLDNDKAGEGAFVKFQEKAEDLFEIIPIKFLAKDLGELWENYGEEKFRSLIRQQVDRLILI
jgi:DNA primase